MDKDTQKELRSLRLAMQPLTRRFGSLWGIFLLGIVQGVGVVIGATLIVIMVGWFVNLLGLIPGLENLASAIGELLDYAATRR